MSTDFGERMLIQLYEIQTPQEAELLIALGVDHCGSVILDGSRWRDPGLRETVRCIQAAGGRSSLIPLFSERDPILRTVDYYRPDIVHFCETINGTAARCRKSFELQRAVRQACPEVSLMRSLPIAPQGLADRIDTLALARRFEPVSDWFLTDTFIVEDALDAGSKADQPVPGFIGITGRTCDWQMARRLVETARIPVILAGGIGPQNVAEGIRSVRPAGVDSCTATNAVDENGRSIRFRKDPDKVRRLVRAVRQMETI